MYRPIDLQIYLRFMEYQMEHSNECKKNFVAVYDGSSAIENLKAKFCSTVANDVMLDNGMGVVRMWADEKSRLSRFRMLFTAFVDRECKVFSFYHYCLDSITLPSQYLSCFAIKLDPYEECGPGQEITALFFFLLLLQLGLRPCLHDFSTRFGLSFIH